MCYFRSRSPPMIVLFFMTFPRPILRVCGILLGWDFSWVSLLQRCWGYLVPYFICSFGCHWPVCPSVFVSCRYSHLHKWFNRELCHKLNCVKTIGRQYKSNPSHYLSQKLNTARCKLSADIYSVKESFQSQLIDDFIQSNNSAKLFAHIRPVNHQDILPSKVFMDSICLNKLW